MIGRPMRLPVASIALPSCGETPLIVIGPTSAFVPSLRIRRSAAAARADAGPSPASRGSGGSAGFASIASIGVASTTLPP
jgi:hypothetical protein